MFLSTDLFTTVKTYRWLTGSICDIDLAWKVGNFSANINWKSINGHEANKFIRDEPIGSRSWISDPVPFSIPVSGVGSSRFMGPESVIIQTVPVIITIIWTIWITCGKKVTPYCVLSLWFFALRLKKYKICKCFLINLWFYSGWMVLRI